MVTVFTPAYNRAHTIHRVYDSLKVQTCKDFEWIVVDDGSSDNTKEVVEGYIAENNDFDITYYYQENQGKHMATNKAVQMARGDLFITLDSDDGCKPNAIERLLSFWDTIPQEERVKYKVCPAAAVRWSPPTRSSAPRWDRSIWIFSTGSWAIWSVEDG